MPQMPAEQPCSHLLTTGGDSEQKNLAWCQADLSACGYLVCISEVVKINTEM